MKIAITDANIFIDLIYLGLHEDLFVLDSLEIHSTHEVIDELNDVQQKSLLKFVKKNKLTLHSRSEEVLADSLQKKKGLSESDKLILHIAVKIEAFVLTGDGLLRKVAEGSKIEVHGILWFLEKCIEQKLITKKKACLHLTKLMGYNKRLPQEECDKRLAEWKFVQ